MGTPDPALGIAVDFPELEFRNAIAFAMQMGRANASLQPVFVFPSGNRAYYKNGTLLDPPPRLDRDGRPFDPEVEVRVEPPRSVTVDCAVEIEEVNREELPVGNFRPSKATVTVLDTAHAQITGCREMRYNGDLYLFAFEPEVNGMFGVNVHSMIFYALKDS